MKILLKLTNQPSNMGSEQLFDDQQHFDKFIADFGGETGLLPNCIVKDGSLTFGTQDDNGNWSGSGKIETRPDNFLNDIPAAKK